MSSSTVSGAVIFAKHLFEMARFYETLLNARVVHADDNHIIFTIGATQLVIHAIPPHIATDIVIHTPPLLREETPIKLFFTVGTLSEVRARASSLGGGLAPPDKEWSASSYRACDGWDPEGNVIQFREDVA